MKPAMTPQQQELTSEQKSALSLYRTLAVGEHTSFFHWIQYELSLLCCSNLTGIVGFGLRSLLYPSLFDGMGTRTAIGKGVVIRQPKKITLGKKVLIDDYATLDVRGADGKIVLSDYVSIGRFSSLVSKNAALTLEQGVNVGSYCRIATQSKVHVGESTLIAAYCYIGPGNHQQGDALIPLISREMEIRGGVTLGKYCWVGAHSTILDGVTIGDNAIIGAHSLVRENVPAKAIVAGSPARIIKILD